MNKLKSVIQDYIENTDYRHNLNKIKELLEKYFNDDKIDGLDEKDIEGIKKVIRLDPYLSKRVYDNTSFKIYIPKLYYTPEQIKEDLENSEEYEHQPISELVEAVNVWNKSGKRK